MTSGGENFESEQEVGESSCGDGIAKEDRTTKFDSDS